MPCEIFTVNDGGSFFAAKDSAEVVDALVDAQRENNWAVVLDRVGGVFFVNPANVVGVCEVS